MGELATFKDWYRYNALVRDLYLQRMFQLSAREQTRDRGASFPSVRDIFLHVLDAYRYWFHHVAHSTGEDYRRYVEFAHSPKQIRQAVKETNELVFGYLDSLRESDLSKTIRATYTYKGKVYHRNIVTRDMLWHMVEEELQHRGELNALFWQLDIDPPVWDWEDWKKNKERKPSIRRWH